MARGIACATLLIATTADAQPPWDVLWSHGQLLWHPDPGGYNTNHIKIDPSTDETFVFIKGNEDVGIDPCDYSYQMFGFSPDGVLLYGPGGPCFYGPSGYQYHSSLFPVEHGRIDVSNNYSDSGSRVGIAGTSIEGVALYCAIGVQEFGYLPGDHHAMLAQEHELYVGGNDVNCDHRLWRTSYPHGLSQPWCACVPHDFNAFELVNDSLLAVGFPTVTTVARNTGSLGSSFQLYTGPTIVNGWSCLVADTLYWISQFGGQDLHVGSYLLNSGPVWEVTIPLQGQPVELHHDAFGRLWTAVGNMIVWIDDTDGSSNSYPFGLSIEGMDMNNGSLVITGAANDSTSYVMRALVEP
ncbi:MAG: hypothetical protein ABI432_11910 [Flavobacteriales bacterium]